MFKSPNGHKCFLIAIEGPDCVGKTLQTQLLEIGLNAKGIKTTFEKIPYKDKVTHPQIYTMLRAGTAVRFPIVFQTLQGTNRKYFQQLILPTLALYHDVIIFDRWTLSTHVYGAAGGVSENTTKVILDGVLEPDLTLVFDGQPFPKENLDSFESDHGFQDRVRQLYQKYCHEDPSQFIRINANRPREVIKDDVFRLVLTRLRNVKD